MTSRKSRFEACHNCRRRRLRCDRSLPHCLKCTSNGYECLGYGRLFRWEQGLASRGKMAGMTFQMPSREPTRHDKTGSVPLSPVSLSDMQLGYENAGLLSPKSLTDPLLQDLDYVSRKYVSYCKQSTPPCPVSGTDHFLISQLLVMFAEISSSMIFPNTTLFVSLSL